MSTPQERWQRTVDSTYAHHGIAATYTPPGGGAGTPCTVLLDRRDQELEMSGRPVMQGGLLEVRRGEIAAPAKGGSFAITGGATLKVKDEPRSDDPYRLTWKMTVA